jgi:hypothetical protein
VVPYDRHGVDAGLLGGQALREARPGCPSQVALARLATALFPAQPIEPRLPAAGHVRYRASLTAALRFTTSSRTS